MQKISWAVQTNLVNAKDVNALAAACEAAVQVFVPFQTIPFSDALPEVPREGKTVFYKATRCMAAVHASKNWSPGVFFDERAFSFEVSSQRFDILNAGAEVTTIAALAARDLPADKLLFLRPCDDSKAFAGEVMSAQAVRDWCHQLSTEECELEPTCPIVVAEPVGIGREWRLFMVGGKVSSGSQYRVQHTLNVESTAGFVEEDVIAAVISAQVLAFEPATRQVPDGIARDARCGGVA